MLPDPVIEMHEGIFVVRDDLIPGGTKQRVLERWLPEMGPAEYVYAGPREGYAQVALAEACLSLRGRMQSKVGDYRATLFVPHAATRGMHIRTQHAITAGAHYISVNPGYLSNTKAQAHRYSYKMQAAGIDVRLLPFGLDDPRFIEIVAEIARAATTITPHEVWVTAGSGTLCRALQQAWPRAEMHAVQVGHAPSVGNANLWQAPEKFQEPAKHPPPFPSCLEYDAKAWQFVREHASRGALFWNVAA